MNKQLKPSKKLFTSLMPYSKLVLSQFTFFARDILTQNEVKLKIQSPLAIGGPLSNCQIQFDNLWKYWKQKYFDDYFIDSKMDALSSTIHAR